jgi:hypothetical protein
MGMENIKKIEDRENEMIDQIKALISKSFPPMLGHKVEYFIGEGEDTHRRFIVFDLSSKAFGGIYRKIVHMHPSKIISEQENDFIGRILTDFILLGTTFLTNNIIASKAAKQEDSDAILKHPFSKGRLNNVNLN